MPRPPKMVEALWASLPAGSGREIADRLTERLERPITLGRAHWLVSHVRQHATRFGWTIPHVMDTDGKEFVRVPVAHDFEYVLSDRTRANAPQGVIASVQNVAARTRNDITALKAIAVQMRPGAQRAKLEELAEDFRDLRRKTDRIVRFVQAANGN